MSARGTYALLYDGDCRICTALARWVKALDFRGRLRIQPIQASRELLSGIREEEILDAMHVVDPGGCVSTGSDSLPVLLEALLAGPPLSALVRSSRATMRVLQRVYGLIVRLRGHLVCRFDAADVEPAARLR